MHGRGGQGFFMYSKGKTAMMIDGSFFLYRSRAIWGKKTPSEMANIMKIYCQAHIEVSEGRELYRIFYYDCPPADLISENPISGKQEIYIKSPQSKWRLAFYEELKKQRKVALRMGELDIANPTWGLSGDRLVKLLKGKIALCDITEYDVKLEIKQKGVDMRIGLDIASISYKKQVDQIILIAGDSDFVPAAKLARREGIDFVLDPMHINIKDNLFEHIDGLRSMVSRSKDGTISQHINLPKKKKP